MIVLDANLLIYAYDTEAKQQTRALRWLDGRLRGRELVGLPWISLLAFFRVRTHPAIYHEPLTGAEALAIMAEWWRFPSAVPIGPGETHWEHFAGLVATCGIRGGGSSDAHLAALAMERGATLCTADRGFSRFPGLRWHNPLEG